MLRTLQETELQTAQDFRYAMMDECGMTCHLLPDWRERTAEIYADMYRRGEGMHVGWVEDGRVVGTAGAMIRTDFPFNTLKGGCYGWIMDVYVQPEWRGRGIARRVAQASLDWLRARDVAIIKLVASDQAMALGLYERMGFQRTNDMRFVPTAAPGCV